MNYGEKVIDYTGGRTSKEITSWIVKRLGDSTTEINTEEEFNKFIEDSDIALIYFGRSKNEPEY